MVVVVGGGRSWVKMSAAIIGWGRKNWLKCPKADFQAGIFRVVIFREDSPGEKLMNWNFPSGSFPWGVSLEPLNTCDFWKMQIEKSFFHWGLQWRWCLSVCIVLSMPFVFPLHQDHDPINFYCQVQYFHYLLYMTKN